MKVQTLVIDLTGEFISSLGGADYIHSKTEYGNIFILNSDPTYPGMETPHGRVLWDWVKMAALADDRPSERDQFIHELFRKFAKATGSKISRIQHVDMTTYIDFKVDQLKNVEDFEWLSIPLEKDLAP